MENKHPPAPCEHNEEWFVPRHGERLNLENLRWGFNEDQRSIVVTHRGGKRLYIGLPGDIFRAVNSYGALVEALEAFLIWHDKRPTAEQDVDLLELAEEALAKARGE